MKQKIVLTVLAIGLVACNKPATTPPSSEVTTATHLTTTPKPIAGFEKLIGKWERPDGGYVLEIRSVGADGKTDAAYFNPAPIHVARALAYREAGETKLFAELQDVNYPGCTYKLVLDTKNDQLFGQYYQASMQQTYDVAFARQK